MIIKFPAVIQIYINNQYKNMHIRFNSKSPHTITNMTVT
jgi:hypothetical protein